MEKNTGEYDSVKRAAITKQHLTPVEVQAVKVNDMIG